MSVYPSLEDMKVDHMMQVFSLISNLSKAQIYQKLYFCTLLFSYYLKHRLKSKQLPMACQPHTPPPTPPPPLPPLPPMPPPPQLDPTQGPTLAWPSTWALS